MREYVINRPAPDAMGRILDQAGPEGICIASGVAGGAFQG